MITKPGPWRITFDTNPDDCNYQCIMCECFSPFSNVKDERLKAGIRRRRMDIDLVRKILKESVGTPLKEIIPSTMGEPLMYKHFDEIIELCHQYNVKLNLTTNGSFPRKTPEEWSKLLVPVTSDVKFSWNGATKETQEKIMLNSKWEQMVSNLETFIRIRDEHASTGGNRCQVTLQLTFLELNVRELPEIIKFAIDKGVDRVKGHHLWAHFSEIKDISMRRSAESIKLWNEMVTKALKIANDHKLKNGKNIILENISILEDGAQQNIDKNAVCPFLNKEAWVNTEGRFSPCCAPDEERKKLGEFGNLYETSLEEIWQSKNYNDLQKNYMNNPLCIGCNMRKPIEDIKKNV